MISNTLFLNILKRTVQIEIDSFWNKNKDLLVVKKEEAKLTIIHILGLNNFKKMPFFLR